MAWIEIKKIGKTVEFSLTRQLSEMVRGSSNTGIMSARMLSLSVFEDKVSRYKDNHMSFEKMSVARSQEHIKKDSCLVMTTFI